jgi:hypothetical protein
MNSGAAALVFFVTETPRYLIPIHSQPRLSRKKVLGLVSGKPAPGCNMTSWSSINLPSHSCPPSQSIRELSLITRWAPLKEVVVLGGRICLKTTGPRADGSKE